MSFNSLQPDQTDELNSILPSYGYSYEPNARFKVQCYLGQRNHMLKTNVQLKELQKIFNNIETSCGGV